MLVRITILRPHFYQPRSAWFMDQVSTGKKNSAWCLKFCLYSYKILWHVEGTSFHFTNDTKFHHFTGKIVDGRVVFSRSLMEGSIWSSLRKVGLDSIASIRKINPSITDTCPTQHVWNLARSAWHQRQININWSPPSAAYMRQWIGSALVQIMACPLFGTKPLSKPMLVYCQLDL